MVLCPLDQVWQPSAKRGFSAGKIDLFKTGFGKPIHNRETLFLWQVTFGQFHVSLDILKGGKTELATHVARLPKMVVDRWNFLRQSRGIDGHFHDPFSFDKAIQKLS